MKEVILKAIESNAKNSKLLKKTVRIGVPVDRHKGVYLTGVPEERKAFFTKSLGIDFDNLYYDKRKAHILDEPKFYVVVKDIKKLNLENPLEEFQSYFVKESKLVANSSDEYEQGLFPDAQIILIDDNAETKVKSDTIRKKRKINSYIDSLDTEGMKNMMLYLTGKLYGSLKDAEALDVALDDYCSKNKSKALAYIDAKKNFPKKTGITTRVKEGLAKRILQTDGAAIMFKGTKLGDSIEECVEYLLDNGNQTEKAQIISELNLTPYISNPKKAKAAKSKVVKEDK